MTQSPEFRIAVEIVLKDADRVLIMKRAEDAKVAPGAWCVPAGKVKFTELPEEGAVRECLEETGIEAVVEKELARRTATIKKSGVDAYRLLFTFLMKPKVQSSVLNTIMNDEHTEMAWVTKTDLIQEKYDILPELKQIILENVF